MSQRILHASTVCTHASTYREDANTWSALGNRCRHMSTMMSTSIPGRPHHHRLPAPTATSRATGGLVLHSRGVPIARIYLSCAIAPTSDFASPPPPAPPQTPSAPATASPTPPTNVRHRRRPLWYRAHAACPSPRVRRRGAHDAVAADTSLRTDQCGHSHVRRRRPLTHAPPTPLRQRDAPTERQRARREWR